jgi:unsaturated rhamnogalacturonyl hydrolase
MGVAPLLLASMEMERLQAEGEGGHPQ